jgi:DNA-binding transcriptional LysR family regulator
MTNGLENLAGLSIERLQTFCMVVEAGSIVAAAKGDTNKQSQFSRQVREIEECVGAKLFERVGKSLQLTERGREFAVLTQGYFKALRDLKAAASQQAEVVHIGAADSILRWVVLPRFAELTGSSLRTRFDFRTCRTTEAIHGVKDGTLDLAIVRSDAADDALIVTSACSMRYCLLVPRALLPGKSAAGIHLVKELPLALLSGDGVFTRQVPRFSQSQPQRSCRRKDLLSWISLASKT